ncbi:hypothetical protein B0H66DRAFT_362307 [Apodospora peruviana]|uniref:Uncharacterized protein n=1 Tax=Apodospora peruviana TaxID=516989 RepID=A0AAE0HXI2_9PEZI|nr:hypothetical protein B0H66DRAFT_362307 [Apodospora peruviana]
MRVIPSHRDSDCPKRLSDLCGCVAGPDPVVSIQLLRVQTPRQKIMDIYISRSPAKRSNRRQTGCCTADCLAGLLDGASGGVACPGSPAYMYPPGGRHKKHPEALSEAVLQLSPVAIPRTPPVLVVSQTSVPARVSSQLQFQVLIGQRELGWAIHPFGMIPQSDQPTRHTPPSPLQRIGPLTIVISPRLVCAMEICSCGQLERSSHCYAFF